MEEQHTRLEQSGLDPKIARLLIPSEKLIINIHQHIIALLKGYIATIFACAIFLLAFVILMQATTSLNSVSSQAIIFVISIAIALVAVITLIVLTIAYQQTSLTITNYSLVQAQQKGLLFRKVARLSMADVEDVSSEQSGILPRLFNYGSLTIQTAGELPNFHFKYCTDPIHISEVILNARDQNNAGSD